MKGKVKVIAATNAFGMGIDKPDVRLVIHMDLPDSIEAYFQEAGRAGRDLKPSEAFLLVSPADMKKLQEYLTKYGITPGTFSMTFNADGTFSETLKGKTTSGKWEVKDSKLLLTVAGIKTLSITTQIDGKDMQFVTDATKLLNLFKTLGAKSSNSNIKTVSSLMKNVKGMQAGITLRKQ